MKPRPDDVSLNIFDQIDSICREFRAEWKQGRRPGIEDWLAKVPEPARPQLFHNLLEAELNYRRRKKEPATSDEYLKRFPQFATQVRQAFDESTYGSMELDQAREADDDHGRQDQTQSFQAPAANRLGEYELVRELGRGGMGVVYEARHGKRGNKVALKTLPTGTDGQELNADRLHRFRKEFRSLSEINHPNLVGMQTLEVDGAQWFFTMDLIEGEDFLSYVRPRNVVDEVRLRDALKQLARGIMALHQRGIIHRDLKPSNVLVEPDGSVAILDFGLVAELQKVTDVTQTRSGMFAGTPRYAAPEQMFGQRSEASDWYALGVMLYESLTGELPFTTKNPMELLRQKQEQDPPSLTGRADLPSDLAELVDGLLKRVPSARLPAQAIADLLHVHSETRSRGSTGLIGSSAAAGSAEQEEQADWLADEDDAILIGREGQIEELQRCGQVFLAARAPRAVFVCGRSGEGKSSLVEKFLRPWRTGQEVLVLSGRCYEREAIPFKAVDCWINSLVSFLRSQTTAWLQQTLPPEITGLAQLFPSLQRVEFIRRMPSIDNALMTAEKLRHLAFGALRQLLVAIARQTPVVVFVDDLQWGDAESVLAFQRIMAPPDPPAVLFVGSYRSDEQAASPFLREWDSLIRGIEETKVQVGPLSLDQFWDLVRRKLPDVGIVAPAELEAVHRESGGNAYLLSQLLESYDRESGRFRPIPLRELIAERLARLPAEARTLLEMLAVAGHDVPGSQVGTLAGQPDSPYAILTRMRNERLVRLLGSGDGQRVDTYHDKIRETVLEELEPTVKRTWHLQIAEALEREAGTAGKSCADYPPEDPFDQSLPRPTIVGLYDLARHFQAADDPRALDYQLLAGEEALRLYANEEAVSFLENARARISLTTSNSICFRIEYGLGVAQLRNQRVQAAIEALGRAESNTDETNQLIQVNHELARAYYSLGQVRRSLHHSELALAQLKLPLPKSMAGRLWGIGWNMLRLILRPTPNALQSSPESQRDARIESAVLNDLGNCFVEIDLIQCVDVVLRCSRKLAMTGDRPRVAFSHAIAAKLFNGLGLNLLGDVELRRLAQFDTSNFPPNIRAVLNYEHGFARYFGGQPQSALPVLKAAVDDCRLCGDNWILVVSRHFIRHCAIWCGTTGDEQAAAIDVLTTAQKINDAKGILWGHYDCASGLARGGKLADAAFHMKSALGQLGPERWYVSEAIFGGERGFFLLQCSAPRQAHAVLAEAWDISRTKWNFVEYCVRCLPLLLEAIVGHEWLQRPSSEDLRLARKLARWNRLLFRNFPVLQPTMLRSLGRLAAARGKHRQAIRLFQQGVKIAQTHGMPFYQAKALLDLAAVEEKDREANRREAIELLKRMESVIPRAEAWLLGDQYDEAVVAPEFDLAAWEREHGVISQPAREAPV